MGDLSGLGGGGLGGLFDPTGGFTDPSMGLGGLFDPTAGGGDPGSMMFGDTSNMALGGMFGGGDQAMAGVDPNADPAMNLGNQQGPGNWPGTQPTTPPAQTQDQTPQQTANQTVAQDFSQFTGQPPAGPTGFSAATDPTSLDGLTRQIGNQQLAQMMTPGWMGSAQSVPPWQAPGPAAAAPATAAATPGGGGTDPYSLNAVPPGTQTGAFPPTQAAQPAPDTGARIQGGYETAPGGDRNLTTSGVQAAVAGTTPETTTPSETQDGGSQTGQPDQGGQGGQGGAQMPRQAQQMLQMILNMLGQRMGVPGLGGLVAQAMQGGMFQSGQQMPGMGNYPMPPVNAQGRYYNPQTGQVSPWGPGNPRPSAPGQGGTPPGSPATAPARRPDDDTSTATPPQAPAGAAGGQGIKPVSYLSPEQARQAGVPWRSQDEVNRINQSIAGSNQANAAAQAPQPPSRSDDSGHQPAPDARQAALGQGNAGGVPAQVLAGARRVAHMGPAAVGQFMRQQGYPRAGNWCGEFAASVMHSQGIPVPPHPEVASNWRRWGQPTNQPRPGDIAVRRNGLHGRGYVPTGSTGSHVTTVSKVYPDGSMEIIGGNQGGGMREHVSANYMRNYDFRTMRESQVAATTPRQMPESWAY